MAESTHWTMLKLLLNRYHKRGGDAVLQRLPEPIRSATQNTFVGSCDQPQVWLDYPQKVLEKIHYSWLLPIFLKIPPFFHRSFLYLLTDPGAGKLAHLLRIPPNHVKGVQQPPQGILRMLAHRLWGQLDEGKGILPLEFLPSSPLTTLLDSDASELALLIDYLGLYDLAEEIKQIIDTKKIKQIYTFFDEQKCQFLRQCLRQQEKMTSSRLNIAQWDGGEASLNKMLFNRGVLRLGRALSGQHPHLIWHICHRMDVGRGSAVQKAVQSEASKTTTPLLIQQLLNTLNFLRKKEPT